MTTLWTIYPWAALAVVVLWVFHHRRLLDWQEAAEPLVYAAIPFINILYAAGLVIGIILEEYELYCRRKSLREQSKRTTKTR